MNLSMEKLYILKNLDAYRIARVRISANGKPYTYLISAARRCESGDLVVVPAGDDLKIGRVVEIAKITASDLTRGIRYKWVNCVIRPTAPELAVEALEERRDEYDLYRLRMEATAELAKIEHDWEAEDE